MGKVNYITNWDEWIELCTQYNIDPYENCGFGIDKGGGDSYNFEYIGDTPTDREED